MFKKINILILFILSSIIFSISSCTQVQLFEKNSNIPRQEWKADFAATGDFTITDTTSLYNIYLILRHTDAYKYNNIWLNIAFQAPGGDSIINDRREIILGTDATGWLGAGMGDIWEVRQLLNSIPSPFKKTGTYHFSIQQIMRDNPLQHIMSVGIRVQKAE